MAWHKPTRSTVTAQPAAKALTDLLPVKTPFLAIDNYRNALKIHIGRLKEMEINPAAPQEGIDRRNAYTKSVIKDFFPLVDDAIANKTDYSDCVLVDVMIFLFNAGEIAKGIDLSLLLIEQGQQMPAHFSDNTTIATFVCRQVYDWASKLLEKDESATPYIDTVAEKIADDTIPLVVHSQILAMAAKHKLLDNTLESLNKGIAYCNKAMEINPEKHGVKTLLGKLQDALKKLA